MYLENDLTNSKINIINQLAPNIINKIELEKGFTFLGFLDQNVYDDTRQDEEGYSTIELLVM